VQITLCIRIDVDWCFCVGGADMWIAVVLSTRLELLNNLLLGDYLKL